MNEMIGCGKCGGDRYQRYTSAGKKNGLACRACEALAARQRRAACPKPERTEKQKQREKEWARENRDRVKAARDRWTEKKKADPEWSEKRRQYLAEYKRRPCVAEKLREQDRAAKARRAGRIKEKARSESAMLTDAYIRSLFCANGAPFTHADIPRDWVELKRSILLVQRKIKERAT